MRENWVAILDFGSQYTHLIARRARECGVYSEIAPYNISANKLSKENPSAIILSGSPASVTSIKSPVCDSRIFQMGLPVLGICYGAQIMAQALGGKVKRSQKREYGKAYLNIKSKKGLLNGLPSKELVWMSHGDRIIKLPKGFQITGSTKNSPVAVMENESKTLYGLQFHPEVMHTQNGKRILQNFLIDIAGCEQTWRMSSFVKDAVRNLKETIGSEKVICALSGGVDSSVLAVLLHRAIGKRFTAIFIDNGLLRRDEAKIVAERFRRSYHINLKTVNAARIFLKGLKNVEDPEKKRKIIGRLFIEVFQKEAKKIGRVKFLAQGTLYPDVIESVSPLGGPSATIKTHHNVGGLPKNLKFELIEPLKELFKDEVRALGRKLGLSDEIIYRQPFPGPGLAVRIIGPVTKQRLDILRQADWILLDEIKRARLYRRLWQAFCVLLPVKTVGVMGDERTYENVAAIRAVTSEDAMTARWARLPYGILERASNRIVNEVKNINRVVYDISSKPPSTIEWE